MTTTSTTSVRHLDISELGDQLRQVFRLSPKTHHNVGARFIHQLTTLVSAEMPLYQSLQVIHRQAGDTYGNQFATVLSRLLHDVHAGVDFHRALARHERYFPPLVIAMVQVGQESGRLSEVLLKLDEYLSRQDKYRKQVLSALMYPAVVLGVAVITVIFLLIFLIPMFSELLEGSGVALPGFTALLLHTGEFISGYWFLLLLGLWLVGLLIRYLRQQPAIQRKMGVLIPKFPFLGSTLTAYYTQIYTDILGTLLRNGMPLVPALKTCARVSQGTVLRGLFQRAIARLEEGETFSRVLRRIPMIETETVELLTIGEETGEFASIFSQIATSHGRELERQLDNVGSILEPLLIIVVGLVVGVILVGMYLPIFQLSSGMQF